MIRLILGSVLAIALIMPSAEAAKTTKKKTAKAKATTTITKADRPFGKPRLGTEHSFSALDVKGRYQYPAESNVTVEDEKGLTDLLGVRRHFKDRLQVEETRN